MWGHVCVAVAAPYIKYYLFLYNYVRMSVCNFVHSRDLCGQYSTIETSTFEDRCVNFQNIDVSPFEDRCHDVSTFGDGCVDFRRSMSRPSEMDVLTFDDRCVDLRRSVIDVSTIEDR